MSRTRRGAVRGGLAHLQAHERRQQRLPLVRVLREPRNVGAAVDHAHHELEHRRRLALRVVHRLRAVGGRRREAVLDAAAEAERVRREEAFRERLDQRRVQGTYLEFWLLPS